MTKTPRVEGCPGLWECLCEWGPCGGQWRTLLRVVSPQIDWKRQRLSLLLPQGLFWVLKEPQRPCLRARGCTPAHRHPGLWEDPCG